ncbi:type II toxin-antitoxin system VapC family toxin [Pseudanabaena sp. PCC 6802]|uniref:type II toxin-antitoxin system VapC family toxin n=1 Tax=Pseudanabaena sp. PCC 6802 TaxID=118173 RepID=UPI000361B830|nr:PIN domain-containing protein [Pseudanabaena sp. PCC 6802]
MSRCTLIDTGPLVAFLKRQDSFHDWAVAEWKKLKLPLLTCEAVIVETCFLLRDTYAGQETVTSMISDGIIQVPFRLEDEVVAVRELMKQYHSVPMALADACLVRMTELYPNSNLFTLDSDFRIYRKNRNQEIVVILPTG